MCWMCSDHVVHRLAILPFPKKHKKIRSFLRMFSRADGYHMIWKIKEYETIKWLLFALCNFILGPIRSGKKEICPLKDIFH